MAQRICIEIREKLGAATVYVQLKHPMNLETREWHAEIKDNTLLLRRAPDEICLAFGEFFDVVAESSTIYDVNMSTICLRLCIQNVREAKPSAADDDDIAGTSRSRNPLPRPELPDGFLGAALCRICHMRISILTEFRRVLEFPVNLVDRCEFFCHAQHKDHKLVKPAAADLLYGLNFVLLHESSFKQTVRTKDGNVFCDICNSLLGCERAKHNAVQLWCDSIEMLVKKPPEEGEGFAHRNVFKPQHREASSALLFKCLLHEACGPEFTKLLLETAYQHGGRQYLLLNVIDKALPVLRFDAPIGSCSSKEQPVPLRRAAACKLFYRLLTRSPYGEMEKRNTGLLSQWQSDLHVYSQRISPRMFDNLFNELQRNALLLPVKPPKTADRDFELSYAFLS